MGIWSSGFHCMCTSSLCIHGQEALYSESERCTGFMYSYLYAHCSIIQKANRLHEFGVSVRAHKGSKLGTCEANGLRVQATLLSQSKNISQKANLTHCRFHCVCYGSVFQPVAPNQFVCLALSLIYGSYRTMYVLQGRQLRLGFRRSTADL